MRRPRRPFTVLDALGTAAHHIFEVRAGVGLVFEPFIGRRAALALWGVGLPAWALAGWLGEGEHIERWIALNNAAGLEGGSSTSRCGPRSGATASPASPKRRA